jgi:TatD DNase family protein
MLIDAHAHLDHFSETDLTPALGEIDQLGIYTLSVSMDLPSWEKNRDIAKRSTLITPAFGIHPWKAPDYAAHLERLDAATQECPWIGEIGLDHYFIEEEDEYEAQRAVFEYFLAAARKQNKIVNLHTKGAEEEVLALLGQHGIERAIVHWYSGPMETFRKLADRGYYFTIGVEVMRSDRIREIARAIPADRLLTETDNPGGQKWLEGYEGMPRLILDVVVALAELRGTTPVPLVDSVQQNFLRLVGDDARLSPIKAALLNLC